MSIGITVVRKSGGGGGGVDGHRDVGRARVLGQGRRAAQRKHTRHDIVAVIAGLHIAALVPRGAVPEQGQHLIALCNKKQHEFPMKQLKRNA